MNCFGEKYNLKSIATAIFMILLLVWFTVSLPFVAAFQQQATSLQTTWPGGQQESDDYNPFGNTTEEKESSGVSSVSEEYLHHNHDLFHNTELFLNHNPSHSVSEYISFHGEMLCPPPNSILLHFSVPAVIC